MSEHLERGREAAPSVRLCSVVQQQRCQLAVARSDRATQRFVLQHVVRVVIFITNCLPNARPIPQQQLKRNKSNNNYYYYLSYIVRTLAVGAEPAAQARRRASLMRLTGLGLSATVSTVAKVSRSRLRKSNAATPSA